MTKKTLTKLSNGRKTNVNAYKIRSNPKFQGPSWDFWIPSQLHHFWFSRVNFEIQNVSENLGLGCRSSLHLVFRIYKGLKICDWNLTHDRPNYL